MALKPKTSLDANRAVEPHKKGQASTILRSLHTDGPATCHELVARTGIQYQSCSGRCGELRQAGCVQPTGETRPTSDKEDASHAEVLEPVQGATITQYVAHMKADRKAKAGPKAVLKAAQALRNAHHANAPRSVWEPLLRDLRLAAINLPPETP